MTLSTALNIAMTGLSVTSRDAGVISANIANALTEGYAPRQLNRGTQALTGGVAALGIQRNITPALLQDLRLASAARSHAEATVSYTDRLQNLVGIPGEAGALSTAYEAFYTSLISAADRPDLDLRLQATVDQAQNLTRRFNQIGTGIQSLRQEADQLIAAEVRFLNQSLSQVADLNSAIAKERLQNRSSAGLEDQRQALLDQVAERVPIRTMPRNNGAIALITPAGKILLDGSAATLEFAPANAVAAHMTQANGLLSGMTLNGEPLDTGADGGLSGGLPGGISGGSLSALFTLRDTTLTTAQDQIDALALDLSERFQTGVDSTLAPGDPGLFTDTGGFVTASPGLAQRLTVSTLVDPDAGGDVTRMRNGFDAVTAVAVGNNTLLINMRNRMDAALTPDAALSSTANTAQAHAIHLMSSVAMTDQSAQAELSYRQTYASALTEAMLAEGVDSDAELQRLLLVEQNYAANARLIQTIDTLLATLLRIGS